MTKWYSSLFILLWIINFQEIGARLEQKFYIIDHSTTQSSSLSGEGGSELAVDGNQNTDYGGNSCTQTTAENQPWWTVDLGFSEWVTKVKILNVAGANSDRLSDIQVWLTDGAFASASDKRSCGVHAGVVAASVFVEITCDQPTKGRYVTVQLTGDSTDRILTLCEVEVYGYRQHVLTRVASHSKRTLLEQGKVATNIYDQYTEDNIVPDLNSAVEKEYFSDQFSEKALFMSPIVACSWDRIQRIHMSLFKDGGEKVFVDFDVSGSGDQRDTFYSLDNFITSSYTDLSKAYFDTNCEGRGGAFFSLFGQGSREGADHLRRLYINCFYNGCEGDVGWLAFFDMDHGDYCIFEITEGDNPVIKYSDGTTKSVSTTWPIADIFTFTADLDDLFPEAISSCEGIADAFYQSALACNVYIQCASETLRYKICPYQTFFDATEQKCVSESTTCTSNTLAGEGCYPDGCSSVTCENSAPCVNDNQGWRCTCKPGFTGDTCGTDNCTDQTLCQNGGTCTRNSVDSYTCSCAEGYEGDLCETEIDECDPDPCNGRGTCEDGLAMYTCTCHDGFTGADCESQYGDCEPVDCNNGECEEIIEDVICHCEDGYSGDRCQTNIDECENSPCGSNGDCVDGVNSYSCDCKPGFSGDTCDTDNCTDQTLCQNGGECTRNSVESFTCDCEDGYEGDLCETETNECDPDPCHGRGTCEDGLASYECTCQDGFTGNDCESQLGDCDPVDCNHGTCEEIVDGYECHCDAGYNGDHCETDIDECASSPCGDNGECNDAVNGYTCNCQAGYSGKTCDTYDGCHDNPCKNGGTCTDADDGGSVQFTCQCAAGYVGDDCQTQTICHSEPPCEHGTCVDIGSQGTDYECDCDEGYIGDTCADEDPNTGSLSAQEGDNQDDAASGLFAGTSANIMYGLLAALGAATIIIIAVACKIIAGGAKRKQQKEENDDPENDPKSSGNQQPWAKKVKNQELGGATNGKAPKRHVPEFEFF